MIKKILLPIDLKPTSTSILDYAVNIASRYEATLFLLHINEDNIPENRLVMSRTNISSLKRDSIEDSMQSQANIDKLIKNIQVEYKVIIKDGEIIDIINSVADEIKPNLVIIGNNGHDELSDYILGTTAMNLVKNIKHPVLIVPSYAK